MDRHDIREIKTFTDGRGRTVSQLVQAFGKSKKPDMLMGRIMVNVQVEGPNRMPYVTQKPFEFVFPEGTGVKAAFEKFEEVCDKALEEHKRRMEERAREANRIQGARSMPNLAGPDGKPLKFPGVGKG